MKPKQFRTFRSGIVAVAACLVFVFGCRTVNSPNNQEGATITTTIAGRVVDESGAAMPGVAITGQNGTATTDANGLFFIANTAVSANRTFVVAKKSGYFDGARAAIPTANGVTYMQITLASNTPIGTIDATSGGTLTLPTGGSIALAANGVVTSAGAPYTGTVSVSAEHLDPAKANFAGLFAGDLTGQTVDGSQTELQSYGVIAAELHGSNGETLQPAAGAPATLTMPIAAAQQASAPPTISLWYFDEALGMWKEEGSAYKTGTDYQGTVQHFSCWNYDNPYKGYGTLTGVIVCNDVPIPGVVVNLGAYVEGGEPYVVTDGSGRFSVRVPANNNAVVLQVLASENNNLYWTNVPITELIPANVTTDVGQISLSSPCPSYLTGRLLDCSGLPTPGMVLVSSAFGISYVYTATGTFQLFAGANTTATVSATASNGSVAQPETVTAGNQGDVVQIPDISACSNASDVLKDISGSFANSLATFSPDGSKLAIYSSTGADVVLYDVSSGGMLGRISGAFPQSNGDTIRQLQFSPDGITILTLATSRYWGGSFDLWKLDGTRLTSASVNANSAAFTPDGKDVIASSTDSSKGLVLGVFEYDLAQGMVVTKFTAPSWDNVVGLSSSGADAILVGYNSCLFWNLANDAADGSPFTVVAPEYSQAGERLSTDASILGIEGSSGLMFYNLSSRVAINGGSISAPSANSYGIASDDAHFAAQYQTGQANTVGLFNISDGSPAHLFDAPAGLGKSSGVAISPNGKLVAAVYPSEIRIWKVQ